MARTQEADIYRYKYTPVELPMNEQHTLEELRNLLRGRTWEQVVRSTLIQDSVGGVYFTARMGRFLGRECVVVVAEGKIVVMRHVHHHEDQLKPIWTFDGVIDGSHHSGFALLMGDFANGRLGDVKLNDLVIGEQCG